MREEGEGVEKGRKEKRKGARGIKRGRRPCSLKSKNNHIPHYLTVIVSDEDTDLVWAWYNPGVGGAKHQ